MEKTNTQTKQKLTTNKLPTKKKHWKNKAIKQTKHAHHKKT